MKCYVESLPPMPKDWDNPEKLSVAKLEGSVKSVCCECLYTAIMYMTAVSLGLQHQHAGCLYSCISTYITPAISGYYIECPYSLQVFRYSLPCPPPGPMLIRIYPMHLYMYVCVPWSQKSGIYIPVKYSSGGWFRLLAQLPLNSHSQWLPVSHVEIAGHHWRKHPKNWFAGTGNMQWSINIDSVVTAFNTTIDTYTFSARPL